jgi:hypothetical protein
MKYAAIAALVAVASAADDYKNGCKKGMTTTFFTDDKCKTVDPDTAAVVADDSEMKAFTDACTKLTDKSSTKMKCDAKGITTTVYTTKDCAGDGADVVVKWTNCYTTGTGDAKKYYQLTGAAALKAAAIALVAIAGSQF